MKLKKPHETWIYKIGAVILALLFWLYVMQIQNPTVEQIFYVPLEARNLADNLVLTDKNIQIEVRVQGSQELIDKTSSKDIHVYADFANVGGVGELSMQVLPVLPKDLQLVSVDPAGVTISLEEITSRSFPLSVKVPANAAAYGYLALEAVLSPSEIIISGSTSALDNISEVSVSVPMENFSQTFTDKLPVEILDKAGNLLNDEFVTVPEVADVFIPVVSDLPYKLVTIDVPVYGEPAPGYQLSRIILEPEAARLFGGMDILNKIKSVSTATVDISGAETSITQELGLLSPEGITIPDNEKTVRAVLVIESIDHRTFTNILIQNRNLADGLTAVLQPEYIDIEVQGPKSAVEGLKITDITAYIDCFGVNTGSYSLPLQVDIPSNVSLVKTSVAEVGVDISRNQ